MWVTQRRRPPTPGCIKVCDVIVIFAIINFFSVGRLEKLKLPGWKNERAVGHFPSGRVLCVKPGDHATHWRKVEEVLSVVDTDLGFSEVGIRWPDKTKVFMYVADKKVVGLLLAESIDKAYRIIPNNGKIQLTDLTNCNC